MKKVIGIVVEGKKLGRTLGFPTANIELREGLESGVYAGITALEGKEYVSAIFIWADKPLLEAHLLDFKGNIYGKEIVVEIGKKIREAKRFENEAEIKKQIKGDISRITQMTTQMNAETQNDADAQKDEFLYSDITYKIRGACFEVYKQFGGGFKEKVIENALIEELKSRNLKLEQQKRIDIYYKDKKVGTYIPDIIVSDKVLVELKCKPFVTKEDERQFWLYLKGSEYKLGLLINFGSSKLEIKRRVYDKARSR